MAWLSVWTLERGADLHVAQLMPLPLTVSCFSKIQIGSTFLVPAHRGSRGQRAVKWVCVVVVVVQLVENVFLFRIAASGWIGTHNILYRSNTRNVMIE